MLGLAVASSARVRVVGQLVLKVKYCHPVFEQYSGVKERCEAILRDVLARNGASVEAIGFDDNHVHLLINLALNGLVELVKKLKGETARRLLSEFPNMKREQFWGSGFWNPSYFFDTGGSFGFVKNYVLNQRLTRQERESKARPKASQARITDWSSSVEASGL